MLSNSLQWLKSRFLGRRPQPVRRPGRGRRFLAFDYLETREVLSSSIPLGVTDWTQIGPAPVAAQGGQGIVTGGTQLLAGRVTAIATDPNEFDHYYIGTAGGGVWETLNAGQTWQPLTDNEVSLYVGAVTIDPKNTNIIYAGTGEANYAVSAANSAGFDSYAGRGILKSTDGGATWTTIGQQHFDGRSISKIYVDPDFPNTIFAVATKGANGIDGELGVWRSFDAGASWANITTVDIPGSDVVPFSDLVIDPITKTMMAAIGDPNGNALNGVYRLTVDQYRDPTNANPDWVLDTSLPHGFPVFNSTSGGFTYPGVFPAGPYQSAGVGRITLSTSIPNEVQGGYQGGLAYQWVSMSDTNGNLLYLGYTVNASTFWSREERFPAATNPFCHYPGEYMNGYGNYSNAVLPNPFVPFQAFVGGGFSTIIYDDNCNGTIVSDAHFGYVYRDGQGRVQYNRMVVDNAGAQTMPYHHAIVTDRLGRILDATDAGLFRLDYAGGSSGTGANFGTWNSLNLGLNNTQIVDVGLHPTDANQALATTARQDVVQFNDSTTWDRRDLGSGAVIYHPQRPDFAIHVNRPTGASLGGTSSLYGNANMIRRTTNGGVSWSTQDQNLNLRDRMSPYGPALAFDTYSSVLSEHRVLLGTTRIYEAKGGDPNARAGDPAGNLFADRMSWTGLGDFDFGDAITAIAVAPSNPNVIYVAAGGTVWVTTTNGKNVNGVPNTGWRKIDPEPGAPLVVNYVDLLVDPTDFNVVYVVAASYNRISQGHIWRTTNGTDLAGATWDRLNGNLPDSPTWTITLDPRNLDDPTDDQVYVGTEQGVYRSSNLATATPDDEGYPDVDDPATTNHAVWQRFGSGLPNASVRDLEFDVANGILAAGTYGRGVWQIRVPRFGENNPPAITLPAAALQVTEDVGRSINGLSVSDPDAGSNPVQVTLSVTSGTLTLNSIVGLNFSAGDGQRDPAMTFTGTIAAINNALNNMAYFPNANYNGSDVLVITVNDLGNTGPGGPLSVTGRLDIFVNSVNDLPTANPDSATTPEDTPVSVNVLANDTIAPDTGESLRVVSVTDGQNGTVRIGPNGRPIYTPNPNFFGRDSFTYTIDDGNGGQATATVSITVTAVADPPTATDDAATVAEDSSVLIDVLANDDAESGDVTIWGFTQGANGSVVRVGSGFRYTPRANFNGTDTFQYGIEDGAGRRSTATVTITVTPRNDPPDAVDDTASTDEDVPVTVDVLANDTTGVDTGETLTIASFTNGQNGTVTRDGAGLRYTPRANFHGTDTFFYTIDDGFGGQDRASVTVTVASANDDPVAQADSATTAEDTAVDIDVLANDSATVTGRTIRIQTFSNGQNGIVRISPLPSTVAGQPQLRYTPNPNFFGTDTFFYVIEDSNGDTSTATVTITVTPVNNDPPTAVDDSVAVNEDGTILVNVLANDSSAPDQPEPVVIDFFTQPDNGTVTLESGQLRYTPNANFFGADRFTYTIRDDDGPSTATVFVNVRPVNDAPRISGPSVVTANHTQPAGYISTRGTAITISDPDAGTRPIRLALSVTAGYIVVPRNSGLTGLSGNYTRSVILTGSQEAINNSINGLSVRLRRGEVAPTVRLTVTVNDLGNTGGGARTASAVGTVRFTNRVPVISADPATLRSATYFRTRVNTPIDLARVKSVFSDPDGDPIVLVVRRNPTRGTLTRSANGSLRYTPPAGFRGRVTCELQAFDGWGRSNPVTVTIDIV